MFIEKLLEIKPHSLNELAALVSEEFDVPYQTIRNFLKLSSNKLEEAMEAGTQRETMQLKRDAQWVEKK